MKARIAVLYPLFLGGGAELVTAWMLQGLQAEYDLTLFTFSDLDFNQINRQFGTTLNASQIHLRIPYASWALLRKAHGYSLLTIRQHLLARGFRAVRENYDLAIAASNEMDLGTAGLQYIHVPLFGHGNEVARRVFNYPVSPARTVYQKMCEWVTGYSDKRMRKNLTLTNSYWTADLIKRAYGLSAEVIYPPVILNVPDVPWTIRETGFIYSGRISPDKNLELLIDTVTKVRQRGHSDVHLHILSGSSDADYRQKIIELQTHYSSWLFIHENLNRAELAQMLAQHRYGLHGRANETFGIGIAEMLQAGCLPFLPVGGGPEEIIGNMPSLKFADFNSAVEKICAVLSSESVQATLRAELSSRKDMFTPEKFCNNFMQIVARCVQNL